MICEFKTDDGEIIRVEFVKPDDVNTPTKNLDDDGDDANDDHHQ